MERILIKFTKLRGAKFLSHLDTVRTIHRGLRRAEIPVKYSEGFNPHPNISVAAPLSLGIASVSEYADIELSEQMNPDIVKERLTSALPDGIEIIDAVEVEGKMPPSMAVVEFARYKVIMCHNSNKEELQSGINDLLVQNSIERLKKTKSGEKLVNIRPFIEKIIIAKCSSDNVEIECLLKAGSRGSIGIELVEDVIKDYLNRKVYGYPVIEREEIYSLRDNKLIDLSSYFLRK